MDDQELNRRVSALDDVELVRLLTMEPDRNKPEVVAAAAAEADRRGLPIDPAFLPTGDEDSRAGAPAAEAAPFQAAGRGVVCTHCGQDLFESKEILLNTRGLTFFKLDWLNRSATALVCANCGLIQLFAGKLQGPDAGE